jgi:phosphoribosylformylglycinamidine cyclo-ligase
VRYEQAGVRGQDDVLSSVSRHLGPTFSLPEDAEILTSFGHYASVIKLTDDLALALTTDGVGSKTLVASALGRYDTIGFDCVAMNVNDVLCVGAQPVAMVDYLGVHTLDAARSDEILRGLGAAAKEAGVAVPGGELAQLPDMIGSDGRGAGDPTAFDLVGACVGTVHPDRLVLGRDIRPGNALIGIRSSGIHSNGLTLARKALIESGDYGLGDHVSALGRTIGEQLLEPTEIYVRAVAALRAGSIEVRGMAHITGDGFLNLCRLDAPVGYSIETMPDPPPIFRLIQQAGRVPDAEMYRVFNMGIGFVVVVAEDVAARAVEHISRAGYRAMKLGSVTDAAGRVEIGPAGLVGEKVDERAEFRPAEDRLG